MRRVSGVYILQGRQKLSRYMHMNCFNTFALILMWLKVLHACNTATHCTEGLLRGTFGCYQCPPGSYQDNTCHNEETCKLCERGKHTDSHSASSCITCPSGKYTGESPSTSHPYTFGTEEVNIPTIIQVQICEDCQAGLYLVGSNNTEDHDSADDCLNCDAGKSSAKGASVCTICSEGKYRPESVHGQECILCPKGSFLEDVGTIASAHDSIDKCIICSEGEFADVEGSTECKDCIAGQYNDADDSLAGNHENCSYCPNGKVSTTVGAQNKSVCSRCEKGQGPNNARSECLTCGAGQYNPSSTAGVCLVCGAGQYNDNTPDDGPSAHFSCTACGKGKYLPQTSDPAGANHESDCRMCDPGKGADVASGSCTVCPAGTYYSASVFPCKTCPRGKFLEDDGIDAALHTSVESCHSCSTGRYLADDAIVAEKHDNEEEDCQLCDLGFYQENIASHECIACASGKYTLAPLGSDSINNCISCPKGYFSESGPAQTIPDVCLECEAGRYQHLITQTSRDSCKPCPIGRAINARAQTSLANCTKCATGTYGNLRGLAECAVCFAGTYQNETGKHFCTTCGFGKILTEGHTEPNARLSHIAESNCAECPEGRYLDNAGGTSDQEFVVKTSGKCDGSGFEHLNSLDQCRDAMLFLQLNYNTEVRLAYNNDERTPPQGCFGEGSHLYFISSTSSGGCNNDFQCICKTSTRDPHDANSDCKKCEKGRWQSATGQPVCTFCEEGRYGDALEQVAAGSCKPCPEGRYDDRQGSDNCKECVSGRWSDQIALDASDDCTPCPNAKYGRGTKKTSESDGCEFCPVGRFMPALVEAAANMGVCQICQVGNYQDETTGTNECKECDFARFQDETIQSDCKDCPAGFIMTSEGSIYCQNCAPGKFENGTRLHCENCGLGMYTSSRSQTECQICPEGTFQNLLGMHWCQSCGSGKYLSDNSTNIQEHDSPADCKNCPIGTKILHAGGRDMEYTKITASTCSKTEDMEPLSKEECLAAATFLGIPTTDTRKLLNIRDAGDHFKQLVRIKRTTCTIANPCMRCGGNCQGSDDRCIGSLQCMSRNSGTSVPGCTTPGQNDNYDYCILPTNYVGEKDSGTLNYNSKSLPLNCFQRSSDSELRFNRGLGGNEADCSAAFPCICKREKKSKHDEASDCKSCPEGYYTDVPATHTCKNCSIGKYSNQKGNDAEEDCFVCPKGKYNNEVHRTVCFDCPEGRYNNLTETVDIISCINCVSGRYRVGVAATDEANCTKCGVGKYMLDNLDGSKLESDCKDCPRGKYNDVPGLSGANGNDGGPEINCKVCPVGTYGDQQGRSNIATHCKSCPEAKYLNHTRQTSSSQCVNCPSGWWQGTPRSHTCDKCPLGFYQVHANRDHCDACPAGFYSDELAVTQDTQILAGARNRCKNCEKGRYGDTTNISVFFGCKLCSAGRFNSLGPSSIPITSDAECEPCSAGMYGDELGCIDDAPMIYNQLDDLAGARFCNKSCTQCPIGRYSTTEGASSFGHCQNCSIGRYNSQRGNSEATDCRQCPDGFFQNIEAEGDCLECPVGQFSLCDTPGTGDAGPTGGCIRCKNCPAGRFAALTKTHGECAVCPQGWYQNEDGKGSCKECVIGRFSKCPDQGEGDAGVDGGCTRCKDCPAGRYTEVAKTFDDCKECPGGWFQDTDAKGQCKECVVGKYSPSCPQGGTDSGTGGGCIRCTDCQVGRFAALTKTADSCTTCPAGWFLNSKGLGSCKECAKGQYSALCAAGSEDASPDGTYAGCIRCKDCPVGRYAFNIATSSSDLHDVGVKDCTTCPNGKFQPNEGTDACTRCAPGKYSVVCSAGSEDAGPDGTYPGCIRCKDCAAGKHAKNYQMSSCKNCPRGRYGDEIGIRHERDPNILPRCKSCVQGKFNEQLGQDNKTACLNCPAGLYLDTTNDDNFVSGGGLIVALGSGSCTEQGHHWTGSSCLNLHNDREADCKSCPSGRYGNITGLVDRDARTSFPSALNDTYCDPCPAGRYFTGEGATGIYRCIDCPLGKYLPKAAQTLLTDCLDCPVGRYSDVTGAVAKDDSEGRCALMVLNNNGEDTTLPVFPYEMSDKPCSGDSSCPTGSLCLKAIPGDSDTHCKACSVGRYNELVGMTAESDCKFCEAGKYGPNVAASKESLDCIDCPIGFYNTQQGQSNVEDHCIQCIKGRFSSISGESMESVACKMCPKGKYSDALPLLTDPVLEDECKSCPGGYYLDSKGNDEFDDCIPCEGGKYSDAGATQISVVTCKACIVGKYSDAGEARTTETVCKNCGAGKYSGTGAAGEIEESHCVVCSMGKYSGEFGATSEDACKACGKGKYLDATGMKTEANCKSCAVGLKGEQIGLVAQYHASDSSIGCVNCSTGKHQDSTGSFSCKDVGEGEYADVQGLRFPKKCPKGQHGRGINDEEGDQPHQLGGIGGLVGRRGCNLCPKGYINAELGSYVCVVPDPGFYADEYGLIQAYDCPTGYFSTNLRIDCDPCPAGKFSDAERQDSIADCKACPKGFYREDVAAKSLEDCIACSPGRFNPNIAATQMEDCEACSVGLYQAVTGQIGCVNCPVGWHGPIVGQPNCTMCPLGWIASTAGRQNCHQCAVGKYEEDQEECKLCPAGYAHNEPGRDNCPQCIAGRYVAGQGESMCAACDPGKYEKGRIECIDCPRGRYGDEIGIQHDRNPSVLPRCKTCVQGKYNDQLGQASHTACINCPVGLYLDTTNDDNFLDNGGTVISSLRSDASCTEQGHHWNSGTCINLDNDREADCKSCPSGRYGNITGLVDKDARTSFPSALNGTYCDPCPAGKYFEGEGATGIHRCVDCPLGKYLPKSGQTLLTDCLKCPIGRYSDVAGTMSKDDVEGLCALMVLDNDGEETAVLLFPYEMSDKPCEDASSCPTGSLCLKAEPSDDLEGTEQHQLEGIGGLIGRRGCNLCPKGFVNAELGSYVCIVPDPGLYADEYGLIQAYDCPTGYYSTNSRIDCDACPAGKFNDAERQDSIADCKACPKGFYREEVAAKSLEECIACSSGRFNPNEAATDCKACPKGFYREEVAAKSLEECIACSSGRFNPNEAATDVEDCVGCALGRFQANRGRIDCANCPLGWIADTAGREDCHQCAVGKYEEDRKECKLCPAGYAQENNGRDSCSQCPSGKRESQNTHCESCFPGRYQGSTGKDYCVTCPAGKISTLPEGEFCTPCQVGKFETGRIECIDCPIGFYSMEEGQSNVEDCILCQKGKYSDKGASVCTVCNPGKYGSKPGATNCTFCPRGYYRELNVSLTWRQCQECPDGYFMGCSGGITCQQCESGRVSNPRIGGTECIAEEIQTAVPVILSPIGLSSAYNPGSHPQDVPNVICVDFHIPKEQASSSGYLEFRFDGGFLVEWSTDSSFSSSTNNTRFLPQNYENLDIYPLRSLLLSQNMNQTLVDPFRGPWSFCIDTNFPVHLKMFYLRVRGIGPRGSTLDTLGTPSQPTPSYTTALDCDRSMYLSQSSYPSEGIGGFTVGAFNPIMSNWRCDLCPTGGDCRGYKRWVDVYAKFGYFRLDNYDFDDRDTAFWPCLNPLACLGGKNIRLEQKYIWLSEQTERPKWPNVTVDGRQIDVESPLERGEVPICCTAIDPEVDNLQGCIDDPPINGPASPCRVDLAKVDDFEMCNEEAGYALDCPHSPSGKCRLCRQCADGWWEQGASNCLKCPPLWVNVLAPLIVFGLITTLVFAFLSSAIHDSIAEANSIMVRFSQPMQKTVLNYVQLISLAYVFPLKWPNSIEAMLRVLDMIGQAGSYMFNPVCNGAELIAGESMFFQKQFGILMLPFIAVASSVLFWASIACRMSVRERQGLCSRNVNGKMKQENNRDTIIHNLAINEEGESLTNAKGQRNKSVQIHAEKGHVFLEQQSSPSTLQRVSHEDGVIEVKNRRYRQRTPQVEPLICQNSKISNAHDENTTLFHEIKSRLPPLALQENANEVVAEQKGSTRLTIVTNRHRNSLFETIHKDMQAEAEALLSAITFRDKCIATIVTVLYLIYPTIVKSTLLLVSCTPVGKHYYLQMDLNIECFDTEHMVWVLNMFVPYLLGFVIGLPILSYVVLTRHKHLLNARRVRFRYGTLFNGYTETHYYWESVIAIRKAFVVAIPVFLNDAGAEAQALSAIMIIILSLILHLYCTPFISVDKKHNTLFWSEFGALFVAFATFWTGLFLYQDVAQKKPYVQQLLTIEVLVINIGFCFVVVRWLLILKLMDTNDQIEADELRGVDEKKIEAYKRLRKYLRCLVPEWRKSKQLWTKRAWKILIRKQIMQNRVLKHFKSAEMTKSRESFKKQSIVRLKQNRKVHDAALANVFNINSTVTNLSSRKANNIQRASRRRPFFSKTKITQEGSGQNDNQMKKNIVKIEVNSEGMHKRERNRNKDTREIIRIKGAQACVSGRAAGSKPSQSTKNDEPKIENKKKKKIAKSTQQDNIELESQEIAKPTLHATGRKSDNRNGNMPDMAKLKTQHQTSITLKSPVSSRQELVKTKVAQPNVRYVSGRAAGSKPSQSTRNDEPKIENKKKKKIAKSTQQDNIELESQEIAKPTLHATGRESDNRRQELAKTKVTETARAEDGEVSAFHAPPPMRPRKLKK